MADHLAITFSGGAAAAIYDDALLPALEDLGPVAVARASHVEPYAAGGWTADMSPVGGPILGAEGPYSPDEPLVPFPTRAEALAAERAWLARERGL